MRARLGQGPAAGRRSADTARAELSGRGVEVSDVQDFPWGRFVFFSDPDGNAWAVQEILRPGGGSPPRRPV